VGRNNFQEKRGDIFHSNFMVTIIEQRALPERVRAVGGKMWAKMETSVHRLGLHEYHQTAVVFRE
jgi:hypothetical protein